MFTVVCVPAVSFLVQFLMLKWHRKMFTSGGVGGEAGSVHVPCMYHGCHHGSGYSTRLESKLPRLPDRKHLQ